MSQIKDSSLDATIKELLQETADEDKTADTAVTEDKPKRTRRTKAQIEADKKAEEEAATSSSESADSEKPNQKDTTELENADPDVPEVIPDTPEDLKEDIQEVPAEDTKPQLESFEPEVVPDSEIDTLPDVEDSKPVKSSTRKSSVSREAIEAFREEEDKLNLNSLVGKSVILFDLTPLYRAPHVSMRIKPYRGHITVIEDPRNGFVKVQFLRQGFGLCNGYMDATTVIHLLGGDNNAQSDV